MRKKFFKLAGIGFLLGVVLGNLISWACGAAYGVLVSAELVERMHGQLGAVAAQTIVGGLYGAACMGGTVLYDIESWPLARSSVLHYLIIAVLYVPMAFLLGWVGRPADILLVEGIQLAVYFLIWLVMWTVYRRQVRELNQLRESFPPEKEDK